MKAFHENRLYRSSFPVQAGRVRNISFLAHWHNDVELVYVREGAVRMGINSETRVLRQGDLAVCSSGDIHFYDSREQESEILLLIFPPQLVGAPGGWPRDLWLKEPFLCSTAEAGDAEPTVLAVRLGEIMLEVEQEIETKTSHYELVVTGLLHELCGLTLRYAQPAPADEQRDKRRMVHRKTMQTVFDWLEAGYIHPVTLEDAAERAGMSLFYFSRTFKSIAGMNFLTYLNTIRVHKAEELILTTDSTILDIALECGFTNVRTFNRVFRQIRGCSPSSLR